MATTVMQTRLNDALHIPGLFCYICCTKWGQGEYGCRTGIVMLLRGL